MPDYAKLKALAQSIIECIGDEAEGENPKLPEQDDAIDDGGQDSLTKLMPTDSKASGSDGAPRKKRKDDAIAIMASTLASKFNK